MKFLSAILCLSVLLVGSNADYSTLVTKCKWNDRQCLMTSSQEAIPKFCDGIPEVGITPLDPLKMEKVSMHESGVHIDFKNIVVTHLRDCKVVDIERTEDNYLRFAVECPILVTGDYAAKGQILLQDINGHGPFSVQTSKIWVQVTTKLENENGYWKVSEVKHEFEFKEKTHLNFENVFDGDKEKSAAVNKLIDENWKELAAPFGKDIIKAFITQVVNTIKTLTKKVPTEYLEIA